MIQHNVVVAAILLLSSAACGTVEQASDASAGDAFSASDAPHTDAMTNDPDAMVAPVIISGGTLGGPPQSDTAIIIWTVTSGSPDYIYKYGQGMTSASGTSYSYTITLPGTPPPPEAINSYGVGVGIVAILPQGVSIADGIVDDRDLENANVSRRHAVIWRESGASVVEWVNGFSDGFSCGICQDGEGFDIYVPAPCDEVDVDVSRPEEFCNWT